MPLIRLTAKLGKLMKVPRPKGVDALHREHEWFADLFYVQGKKSLLCTHRTTLLAVVKPAVAVADLRDFDHLFQSELSHVLRVLGMPCGSAARLGGGTPAVFAATDDRRVLGSMVDYRFMFEHMVMHAGGLAGADLDTVVAQLNDTPMSVLGMDRPIDHVRKLLAPG